MEIGAAGDVIGLFSASPRCRVSKLSQAGNWLSSREPHVPGAAAPRDAQDSVPASWICCNYLPVKHVDGSKLTERRKQNLRQY